MAYKATNSTESALKKVNNDIHCSLAKHKYQALVLFDLSAVVDTIAHEIFYIDYSPGTVFTTRQPWCALWLGSWSHHFYNVHSALSKLIQVFKYITLILYADDTQIYA